MVSEDIYQVWVPWSDQVGKYHPIYWSYGARLATASCSWLNKLPNSPGDWRPVQIPTPIQTEVTTELLAALKGILESTDSDAIGKFESDAAYAAIAEVEGRGSDD